MQLILGGDGQQVMPPVAEGRRQQRRPGQVVDRVLVGDLPRQGGAGRLGQQFVVGHHRRKAEAGVHFPLDRIHFPTLKDAGGQPAQQGRGHVVGVALDGGGQGQQLLGVEHVPQHPVGPQQAGDDAGRRGAQAPRHGDGVGLDDLQRRDALAHPVEQALGRAVDQVGLAPGDAGAVRRRDVQLVALLKGGGVVQGDCQAHRVEAGAHVGAGGRDRNFDLHGALLQSSAGRRRSTSLTLPPTASILRAAASRAAASACSII